MRLLILQYAGDYREAFQRFERGGEETYYAQKYSVNAVAEIAQKLEEVTTICCLTNEYYTEILSNGVKAIGAGFKDKIDVTKIIHLIEQCNPTHLVLRTPMQQVLQWAIKHNIKTITTFAESVSTSKFRDKYRNYRLSNLLNNENIEWVGSYGINSSLLFQKIGVKPEKIIPWDFLGNDNPANFSVKYFPEKSEPYEMLYIGSLIKTKGVGDIIEAVSLLNKNNFPVRLKIAGKDEIGLFTNQSKELNIEDKVEFLGIVPNSNVLPLMREADAVLVPSHHEYPEGFPLAISHALCSRTPIIASDHPMFQRTLKHDVNAMIFPAGNALALARCIEKLFSDPNLYYTLSEASKETWQDLQLPVKWADLINCWVDNSPKNHQWLFENRLDSGKYKLSLG